jgi:hypothetical protein
MDLMTARQVVRAELMELGIYGPDDALHRDDMDSLKVFIWGRQRALDTLSDAIAAIEAARA